MDENNDAEETPVEGRLFEMPRQRRKENWLCIKLIAAEDIDKRKKYTSSDAIGAYCTLCESRIAYSHTNPSNVSRHMNAKHEDILSKYNEDKEKDKKRSSGQGNLNHFLARKKARKIEEASRYDRKIFEMLIACWTCTSLRPFSISEDFALQEVINHANATSGSLSLPSRNLNRENVMKVYEFSKTKLKDLLKRRGEVHYFSCTSDLWSSRTMEAFLALTIHYLTDDFVMKKFVLKVDPVVGKHTADFIRQIMEDAFEEWNLDVHHLSMMIRDSGSNMVRACEDWEIPHFSCVGHSLHLVVGPLPVEKKKRKQTPLPENEDIDEVEDIFDDDDESWSRSDALEHVRNVVNDFRKATKFF